MKYDTEMNEGKKIKDNLLTVEWFFTVPNASSLLMLSEQKGPTGLQRQLPTHYNRVWQKFSKATMKMLLAGANMDQTQRSECLFNLTTQQILCYQTHISSKHLQWVICLLPEKKG